MSRRIRERRLCQHAAPESRWTVVEWFSVGFVSSPGGGDCCSEQQLHQPSFLELDHVLVQTSLYTSHFNPQPEHNNNQRLIGLEFHNSALWFTGLARFKNSFSQDTHYFYVGREFPIWGGSDICFRAKLTAGALHGYRGEYRDKIPFNRHGIAPAILTTLGVRWKRLKVDMMVFGTVGMMVVTGLRY